MCHYEVLISEVRVQVSGAIFQEMQAAFENFYRIPLPEAVIQRALKPRSEHLSPPITRAPSLLSPGINHFHHNSNKLILLIKIWYKWRGMQQFWNVVNLDPSEIAGNKVSVNIPPVHNLRQRSTMADGDNNHPQPLWTGSPSKNRRIPYVHNIKSVQIRIILCMRTMITSLKKQDSADIKTCARTRRAYHVQLLS